MAEKGLNKYMDEAFHLALTGSRNNIIDNSDNDLSEQSTRINSKQIWKELISNQLLKSAVKIPKREDLEIPEEKNLRYAPPELDQLIRKWTIDFNGILLKQCFSILKFKDRLLCPESCWRILATLGNKPHYWNLLTEILGPEADFLSKKNSKWKWWKDINTELSWKSSSPQIRLDYFSFLRQRKPTEAADLITKSWESEILKMRKQVIYWMQFGLNEKDVPFLQRALKDRSKEIKNTSFLYLARLGAPPVTKILQTRFHRFMERSIKYSGQELRFDPVKQGDNGPRNRFSDLSIFTDSFNHNSLRWLILVHPREFYRYIRTEGQFAQLMNSSELHTLTNVFLHSIAFHQHSKWAERMCKYGLLKIENEPRDALPWRRIISVLSGPSVNKIISTSLKQNSNDALSKLILVARNSGSVWSIKNSLETTDILVNQLNSLSRIPDDTFSDLASLGLRLDPGVFKKLDKSLNQIHLNSPLSSEVQRLRNNLHDRFLMTEILLNS